MARFLAIDWEQQILHVVQASTVRGGVRVEQALSWNFPEPLTAPASEALGKKLRDALKEANVAVAPVLACVGRDKVILKELRFPAVPPREEPAVVRFQAAKELTESVEDSIIDYTLMGNGGAGDERQALAVIVRKEVIHSLQGLCRGLGTKLLAVTPRPSAVIGALDRSRHGKVTVGAIEALLVIGPRWADLGILRGQTMLFARSLGVGANLAVEVKRSLAVFNAGSETSVSALYVASDADEAVLTDRLKETLGFPVQVLDSFLEGDTVQVDRARRGRFTAAIGLLQRWSEKPELGINFISPKEPREDANPRKRQKVFASAAVAAFLLVLAVIGYFHLAGKKAHKAELDLAFRDKEEEVKRYAQESADITALKDWNDNRVSWLNEIYDLTARFPVEYGFKLNSLVANTNKKGPKDNYVATMTLSGVAPLGDDKMVYKLVEEINKTASLKATPLGVHLGTDKEEFQIKVDLKSQTPDKYTTVLKIAPASKGAAAALAGNSPADAIDDGGDDQ